MGRMVRRMLLVLAVREGPCGFGGSDYVVEMYILAFTVTDILSFDALQARI